MEPRDVSYARIDDMPHAVGLNLEGAYQMLQRGVKLPDSIAQDLRAFHDAKPPPDAGPKWIECALLDYRHDVLTALLEQGVRPSKLGISYYSRMCCGTPSLHSFAHQMLHDAVARFGDAFNLLWFGDLVADYGPPIEAKRTTFGIVYGYLGSVVFAQDLLIRSYDPAWLRICIEAGMTFRADEGTKTYFTKLAARHRQGLCRCPQTDFEECLQFLQGAYPEAFE